MTPTRAWRKACGLTQAEAAKRLGYSKRQFEKWDTGTEKPPLVAQLAMAALEACLDPIDEDLERGLYPWRLPRR